MAIFHVWLSAGAYIGFSLNKYLGLQLELLYSQNGYQIDFEDYDFLYTGWGYLGWATNLFKFDYIEVPVLMKARTPWRISPYGIVGASIALLISSKFGMIYDDSFSQSLFDGLVENPSDYINDWGADLNTIDVGIVAGIGVEFPICSYSINLETRYTFGLMPVSNDLPADYTNSAFSFTGGVGYGF